MFALFIDNTLDTEALDSNMGLYSSSSLCPGPHLLQPPLTSGRHSPAFSGASAKAVVLTLLAL